MRIRNILCGLLVAGLLLTGLAGIGACLGARKKAAAGGQEKDRTKKTNKAGGAKK